MFSFDWGVDFIGVPNPLTSTHLTVLNFYSKLKKKNLGGPHLESYVSGGTSTRNVNPQLNQFFKFYLINTAKMGRALTMVTTNCGK